MSVDRCGEPHCPVSYVILTYIIDYQSNKLVWRVFRTNMAANVVASENSEYQNIGVSPPSS